MSFTGPRPLVVLKPKLEQRPPRPYEDKTVSVGANYYLLGEGSECIWHQRVQ